MSQTLSPTYPVGDVHLIARFVISMSSPLVVTCPWANAAPVVAGSACFQWEAAPRAASARQLQSASRRSSPSLVVFAAIGKQLPLLVLHLFFGPVPFEQLWAVDRPERLPDKRSLALDLLGQLANVCGCLGNLSSL